MKPEHVATVMRFFPSLAEFEVPGAVEDLRAALGVGDGGQDAGERKQAAADRKDAQDLGGRVKTLEGAESATREALNDVAQRVWALEAKASSEPAAGAQDGAGGASKV